MKRHSVPRFQTIAEALWSRVNKNGHTPPNSSEPCWEWTGYTLRDGYGQFGWDKRYFATHRVSWELRYGPIPLEICVLHRCDNPACVNPSHLFLGTHEENVADKMSKRRQARGETQGSSKLLAPAVLRIFELRAAGMSMPAIGRTLGCSPQNVMSILRREGWKHLAIPRELVTKVRALSRRNTA